MTDHFNRHIAWSQELYFINPSEQGRQVARAHWYLSDDDTICGSGTPDPKEINWNGMNTHIHSDGGVCELCESGDEISPAYEDRSSVP
jgi:hypothetical protein